MEHGLILDLDYKIIPISFFDYIPIDKINLFCCSINYKKPKKKFKFSYKYENNELKYKSSMRKGNRDDSSLFLKIFEHSELRVLEIVNKNSIFSYQFSSNIKKLEKLTILRIIKCFLFCSIPEEIGDLKLLENLDLKFNSFVGSVPESIGNLSNLRFLNLSYNKLNSQIPDSIFNCTNLIKLDLSNNELYGSISIKIGNLINLEELNISNNLLSGTLPMEIGKLTKISSFNISNNSIYGSIPFEIINWKHIRIWDMSYNKFSDKFRIFFNKYSTKKLRYINLSHNQLTGNILEENISFKNCHLNLENNKLSGKLPYNYLLIKRKNKTWININKNKIKK